jgi:hypothetical protein
VRNKKHNGYYREECDREKRDRKKNRDKFYRSWGTVRNKKHDVDYREECDREL